MSIVLYALILDLLKQKFLCDENHQEISFKEKVFMWISVYIWPEDMQGTYFDGINKL